MGFWAGMNEGLTYVLDKKAEKESEERDRSFLRETRDEERRYQESQNGIKYLQDRTLAAFPLLVEQRNQEKAAATQKAQIGSYFKGRIVDLPEETRDAVLNLTLQDTAYSTALMKTVQETEEKLGRALTGNDILNLTDIIGVTKPEGVSLEDWTKQAAGMTMTSGSSLDFDKTRERLFSGDMTIEEIDALTMDALTSTDTSLNIPSDFSTYKIIGVDPATQKSLRENAMARINLQFQLDTSKAEREADAASKAGSLPSEELAAKKQELLLIANEPEADRKEAMMLGYYAPTILPKLAEEDARYTTVYPEFFQSVDQPETVYEILDDEDYNELPSRAYFRSTDGILRRKP